MLFDQADETGSILSELILDVDERLNESVCTEQSFKQQNKITIGFIIIQIVRFSIEILQNAPKVNICGMFDMNRELLYGVSKCHNIDWL